MSEEPRPGWSKAPLREICTFNPKHDRGLARTDLVSFVPMPAVSETSGTIEGKESRPFGEVSKGYTHLREGDVLFAKITPCMENGKIAVARELVNGLGCGSTEFHVMRPCEGISADYLWRFLRQQSFRSSAEREMTGAVGQRRVPKSYLESFSIPIPPAAEQRRIAAKLDQLFARVERARAELDRGTMTANRFREAVLWSLFEGLLVAEQSGSRREVEIGAVIQDIGQGWSPKCEKLPADDSEEWGVITTTAIQAIDFLPGENKRLPTRLSPRVGLEIKQGDVLITRAGPRNRCAVCCYVKDTRPRLLICDKVYRVVLKDQIDPEFFVLILNSPQIKKALDRIKTGGSESGLNLTQGRFKELMIPVWRPEIQRKAVAMAHRLLARTDPAKREIGLAHKLLERIEVEISAHAFQGRLVAQDPNDEPANVLLERIGAARELQSEAKRRGGKGRVPRSGAPRARRRRGA